MPLTPAIRNLFYFNLPFFEDREGQIVYNKIRNPKIELSVPQIVGTEIQKKEQLARLLVRNNFINKTSREKKSNADLELLRSIVNNPSGKESEYFDTFVRPILSKNGLETNPEELLKSFESKVPSRLTINNYQNKKLEVPDESINYLDESKFKPFSKEALESLQTITGGWTSDKRYNRDSITDDELFRYISNIIKNYLGFTPSRSFVTDAQRFAKEALDIKPELSKEIYLDDTDMRPVTLTYPNMSPDGDDISLKINVRIPSSEVFLDPDYQKYLRSIEQKSNYTIKPDINKLYEVGKKYLEKIFNKSKLSAIENNLETYNSKEHIAQALGLVDIARQLNIDPEITIGETGDEKTTIRQIRGDLVKDNNSSETSPHRLARKINNDRDLKDRVGYQENIIKANDFINFLYEFYKNEGVERSSMETSIGREDVTPVLKVNDILKNVSRSDNSEKALSDLSDQIMSSEIGRKKIESYTKQKRNYPEVQYIDKKMISDILDGNDSYKNYFEVSSDGSSLKKISWNPSKGTGYTYEHVVPIYVLTSIINYIILNVDNKVERDNIIERVIDSMYRIAYIPVYDDYEMNKTELQYEIPRDVYNQIGIDSIEKMEGTKNNIIKLKKGLDIDDLMRNIESLDFEKDLQKRYRQFGINDIVSLKDVFKGKKEIPLYKTKATDRRLKGKVNESKTPKLTSMLFGYYG